MTFAVKNRKTGKFFGGFSVSKDSLTSETLWVSAESAKAFTKLEAQMQAHLLHTFDNTTQIKPVSI